MKRLHVLLPTHERAGLDADIRRHLARADQLEPQSPGLRSMLAETFSWPGTLLAAGALTRQAAAGDAEHEVWLCADPARVEADINGARMMACANLGLSAEEAEQLAAPLRPILGDAGALLELTTPDRWHLRLPAGTPVPKFATPDQVLGENLLLHLEGDGEKRRWRRLFTEVQTELHRSLVNVARKERGLAPVNALWFWGGGALPAWVRSTLQRVYSDDPLLQALAQRAGVANAALAAFEQDQEELAEHSLLDLGQHAMQAAAWQELLGLLRNRRVDELALRFADGRRVQLKRWHHWRFWRRG